MRRNEANLNEFQAKHPLLSGKLTCLCDSNVRGRWDRFYYCAKCTSSTLLSDAITNLSFEKRFSVKALPLPTQDGFEID
jgi:hypothetical protein